MLCVTDLTHVLVLRILLTVIIDWFIHRKKYLLYLDRVILYDTLQMVIT